jgi:membrane protein
MTRTAESRGRLCRPVTLAKKKEKEIAQERLASSTAATLWGRLSAMDFLNQAIVFAAVLLLTLFPFLIVLSSATGHDFARSLSTRMGLNHQASDAVATLFRPGSSHVSLGIGWAFLALDALGTAATLRVLYERVFGLGRRGPRDVSSPPSSRSLPAC